jgi:hypothetical protein
MLFMFSMSNSLLSNLMYELLTCKARLGLQNAMHPQGEPNQTNFFRYGNTNHTGLRCLVIRQGKLPVHRRRSIYKLPALRLPTIGNKQNNWRLKEMKNENHTTKLLPKTLF